MEKCSLAEHNDIDAIYFCDICKIYMCYKCNKFHSELFKKHNPKRCREIKETEEIFIGLCLEENHLVDLQYFCKSHNKLCCAKCITKIKSKENGQHTNCDICLIESIENEKKLKLKKNIIFLENYSLNLNQVVEGIKQISEKISEYKEELKTNIQKIFTKLRNALNNREDELLLEVDKKYNEIYLDEQIIKKYEKLPNKVKMYLEKGKIIEKNWESNKKLNKFVYECLNIEYIINDINKKKEKTKNYNLENNKFEFLLNDNIENNLLQLIQRFGKISKIESNTLEKESKEIKSEVDGEKDNDIIKHSFFIKSSLHQHPIEVLRRFINSWYCDICEKSFKDNIPSYHCTICDFDICYNCVKNKVVKGTIKDKIKEYY